MSEVRVAFAKEVVDGGLLADLSNFDTASIDMWTLQGHSRRRKTYINVQHSPGAHTFGHARRDIHSTEAKCGGTSSKSG